MCRDSNSKLLPSELNMEAGFREYCSKLLELAATDDLAGFEFEVEERGCDIDEVSFWYGRSFGSKKMGFRERTPIMIASLYGSMEVLKYIMRSRKVDVNRACGSDGATALHCAAAGGAWSSLEAVKLLIDDASADYNVVDVNGKKPVDLIASCVKICSNFRRRMLEMMLSGIKVEASDEEEVEETLWPVVKEESDRKEYPIDVLLPDINNGIYGTDEFRMYSFKVKPCSRAYSHDWTECPFVHPSENARRRDPRKYHYTCVPCPEFKKGSCAKGDACEYAHGVFESWLHPAQYRTRLCKDETGCSRKVCFFAHKTEELRPLYAATGSAMPSPKSLPVNSMDLTSLSPLSLGPTSMMHPNASSSTPPMSPSVVACSSPMGGGSMWQSKVNLTPPTLQLPGSRLKTTLSARDVDLNMELLGLDQIRMQQRQQQLEEMASLSSPYTRMGDLKPRNLDDFYGSMDPNLLSQFQCLSPKMNSTMSAPMQLRASYPSNITSSPSRNPSPYGFDSSAAVAAAVMNSRSVAFSKRSQSFIDRSVSSYRAANSASPMPSKLSEWSSPDGKLDWGFNGEEVNKLRKSTSFGFRSGNNNSVDEPNIVDERDIVGRGSPRYSDAQRLQEDETMSRWLDQMYIEQEQIVA